MDAGAPGEAALVGAVAVLGDKEEDFAFGAVFQAAFPAHLPGCGEKSRLAEAHIGYTSYHLPVMGFPVRIPAIPAIFAARIARSSLLILDWLKYGRSAESSVR